MSIPTKLLALTALSAAFVSCAGTGGGENYDTASGYDTSNPYGVPNSSYDSESAPYQQVNAPPENPTYSPAAYEDASPAPSSASYQSTGGGSHTIVRGDTLWGLSKKYGVSVDAIRQANNMGPVDNTVVLGRTINIPN